MSKLNEGNIAAFKCKGDTATGSTIYMYLFKNGEIVKMHATTDDAIFYFTNLTVEDSGSYTCLYAKDRHNVTKTNATGHSSVSLEVLGRTHS